MKSSKYYIMTTKSVHVMYMLLPEYILYTVYARAAEGEAVVAIAVEGRVDARRIEVEVEYITNTRRMSP